jgi:hypothetical protein
MYARFPTYGLVLLFLVFTATAACDRLDTPASPAPKASAEASLTAEPAAPRPELLHSFACPTRPGFGIRLIVIASGEQDLILRGIRFAFMDRFGDRAFPQVIPTPTLSSASTSLPSSSPIPIPGAAPLPGSSLIPVPGALPIEGLLISGGGSRSLPFFLTFGCGLVPEGTITISADTATRSGSSGTSQLLVPVRR